MHPSSAKKPRRKPPKIGFNPPISAHRSQVPSKLAHERKKSPKIGAMVSKIGVRVPKIRVKVPKIRVKVPNIGVKVPKIRLKVPKIVRMGLKIPLMAPRRGVAQSPCRNAAHVCRLQLIDHLEIDPIYLIERHKIRLAHALLFLVAVRF